MISNIISELEDEFNKPREITHIFITQRSKKKYTTSVQDLPQNLDYKSVLSAFKERFNCGGTITETREGKQIITLQGDQRDNVESFLINEGIKKSNEIKIHGF